MVGRHEWVEVQEPNSNEKFYANLQNGECSWLRPSSSIRVVSLNSQSSQWWELIDSRTNRVYYFRPDTLETNWKRPSDLDAVIIPLARLHVQTSEQAARHNRAPPSSVLKRDNCTQTALRSVQCSHSATQTCDFLKCDFQEPTPMGDFRSLRQYLMTQAKTAGTYDDQYWDGGSEEYEDDEEEEEEDDDDDEDEDDDNAEEEEEYDPPEPIVQSDVMDHELEDSYTSEIYTEDVGFEDEDDDDDDDDNNDHEQNQVDTVKRKSQCNLIDDLEQELQQLDHLHKLQRLTELERLEQLEQMKRADDLQRSTRPSVRTSSITSSSVDSWQIKDQQSNQMPSQPISSYQINAKLSSQFGKLSTHDDDDYDNEVYESYSKNKSSESNESRPKPPTRINSLTPAQTLLNKPLPSKKAAKIKIKSSKSIDCEKSKSSSVKSTLTLTSAKDDVIIPKPLPQTPKEAQKAQKALKKLSKLEKRTKSKSIDKSSIDASAASSDVGGGKYEAADVDAANEQLHEYAKEHMKRHLGGGGLKHVFKRQRSTRRMLEWTKSSLKQPMLATGDAAVKTQALDSFRMIQMYCGDRPPAIHLPLDANQLCDQIAFDLITIAMARNGALKDELLVQLCRQSTRNPCEQSIHKALRLMCTCLYYFSPSATFAPYLAGFLASHEHQFARDLCLKRLRKRCGNLLIAAENNSSTTLGRSSRSGNRKTSSASGSSINSSSTLFGGSSGYGSTTGSCLYASTGGGSSNSGYSRTPASIDEVRAVRVALEERYPGVFGESLESQVNTQSSRWPKRKLPWTLVGLCEAILRLQGARQEGIFRIAGDVDEMSALKLYLDCLCPTQCPADAPEQLVRLAELWKRQTQRSSSNSPSCLLDAVDVVPVDVHVFACLLKQWFRELPEPLWPRELYNQALESADDAQEALNLLQQLPTLNRLVLGYLVRLLQVLSAPANVTHTKMDECNLATVWAPNLLRPSLTEEAKFDAGQLFENTRKEMAFVRTLIRNLDTGFVQGLQ